MLAARMPCEHIPFIPHLDGFSDYRRGRLGHQALTAPAQFLRPADTGDHVGPKNKADPYGLAIIQRRAIEPEEAFLERRFGATYINYTEKVRRWL